MTALSFVGALVGMLGVLIFVHELGHFLVAKACGVRVLKFSLGFGSPIGVGRYRLRWCRNGTEYVVAWFPLGGFVKMLGEVPGEGEEAVPPGPGVALTTVPIGQRLAIVFAGPLMNLLLPVVIFTGQLFVGMPRPAPVVGTVEPASPAAEAGLLPGDHILAMDGQSIAWWDEVAEALRARPGEDVTLEVEREDQVFSRTLVPRARDGLDSFGGVEEIGWAGLGHARLRALVGVPDAEAPAARSGLRSGDRIVSLAGEEIADWSDFVRAYTKSGESGSISLEVERGEESAPVRESFSVPALGDVAALGVIPANALISEVTEGSPAARAGLLPGDLILAVDDKPVGSFASFAEMVRASGGRSLQIIYARAGETRNVVIAPERVSLDTGLGVEEERYLIGISAEAASLPGTVALDRERNPLVALPRAVGLTADMTLTYLRGLGKIVTGEVSRSQIAGPIGIAVIAHNALQQGFEQYLAMLILISINLGILNLLPIPILDGGQALLFAIEGMKRSPVSLRTREIVQQVGFSVLLLLMGLAFWNDVTRYWSRVVEYVRQVAGV